MGISFFNKPVYKKFNLPSRYYDEEKSEFQRRLHRWERLEKQRKEEDTAVYNREEFRAELKMRWQSRRESGNFFNRHYTNRRRMLVLVILVAVLLWAMYLIGKKYMV